MTVINYDELDFTKYNKLDISSRESDIYTDGVSVYKLFKPEIDIYQLALKNEKLKLLERKKVIDSIVVPNAKIINPSFVGIREDYIEGVDLYNARDMFSEEEFIPILLNVSRDLEKMHESDIIISDLNFCNIRLDKDKNHYFLDVLSYSIDKLPTIAVSNILVQYLKRNMMRPFTSSNNDKIAFLLNIIQLFIGKDFSDITDYDLKEKSEKIKELKELQEIYTDLQNYYVDDVPYLHELIKG